jgi:N-acetylmuramoyl-L-alanine amidase
LKQALVKEISGAPPYGEPETAIPELDRDSWIRNWKRPAGPARVGLQVGHWKNQELPEELDKLKGNTGASGGGKTEAEVNLAIAQETANLLQKEGVVVDIIPATVPRGYWADAFIAIHADGSTNAATNGFKIAAPWRDFSGDAETLVNLLREEYQYSTKMVEDPNITRNMRGYYAFSWWRYDHAIHPMTTGAIVETGFLTSPADRKIIVSHPEVPAQAIARGVLKYLQAEGLR